MQNNQRNVYAPGYTEEKESRFRSLATSFYTELLNNNYLLKKNAPVKLTLLQKDLLKQITLTYEITRPELCERLNVSLATIRRNIAQLKEKELIDRVGSDKGGHWVIIEQNTKETK